MQAIIAVSEDDTCESDKKPLHEKTNFTSFFFIFVFLYTDFYDRQKYWGGGHHPCRPCSDAHAILRSFSKSVMQTSCGQFMQFIGPRMPPAAPTRGYDVSK